MSSQNKIPKTRAFASKVRTGCLTCKKRRKKCDEEKPICHRCRDGNYVCDGYPGPDFESNMSNGHQTPNAVHTTPPAGGCSGPLSSERLPGNALDNYFRHHFFTHTVSDLVDLPNSAMFWTDTVVTLSQRSSFIQHATIALGAAHWLFLAGMKHNTRLESFVDGMYNQAIGRLVPSMTLGHSFDLPSIMTCCLLFVCLESLRGNQDLALRHLEAGSRLFLDRLVQPSRSEPILQHLATMFHSISHQSALFSGNQLLPDLAPYLPTFPAPDKTNTSFSSLDEASDALDKLDSFYNCISWNESSHCRFFIGDECECLDSCSCLGCREWQTLKDQVTAFGYRFQSLAGNLSQSRCPRERQSVLRLQLLDKMWQWTIQDDEERGVLELDFDKASELLDLIERILDLSAVRPFFSLCADIIPSVISIYDACGPVACRQRAINLLRRYPRQEVIFNSEQAAAYLEHQPSSLDLEDRRRQPSVVDPSTWPRALIEFQFDP